MAFPILRSARWECYPLGSRCRCPNGEAWRDDRPNHNAPGLNHDVLEGFKGHYIWPCHHRRRANGKELPKSAKSGFTTTLISLRSRRGKDACSHCHRLGFPRSRHRIHGPLVSFIVVAIFHLPAIGRMIRSPSYSQTVGFVHRRYDIPLARCWEWPLLLGMHDKSAITVDIP